MRVRTAVELLPRGDDSERGATAIIVVLSLVALFGLIVLTVDVGQLLYKRRSMVNASDAAALAAAQSCATLNDSDSPEAMADAFALDNVNDAITGVPNIREMPGCDSAASASGHVIVDYGVDQALFFAGVLGFEGPATVSTAATAGWGTASATGSILPIILYSSGLQGNCDLDISNLEELPSLPPGGPACYFWFDKDVLEGASWGFINLNTWPEAGNTSPYPNCSNVGGADDMGEWIGGTWEGGPLASNYPDGRTYVCSSSGYVNSNWESGDVGDNLRGRIGDIVVFPVNDPENDIEGNNGVEQYDIIGFAPLELVDLLDGVDAGGVPPTSCRRQNFWQPTAAEPTLFLSTVGPGAGCPDGTSVDGAEDILVGSPGSPPGANYDYDATNQALTWTGNTFPNSPQDVEFTWWSEGECGVPPPGQSASNAVCIKTVWQGVQLGGSFPDQDSLNLGLRSVVLCDLEFGSCPEQQ